jgi:hypothetical protein
MKKMFLLFSHSLTEEQRLDAVKDWGVKEFVGLPADLQGAFSNVAPELEDVVGVVKPFKSWLKATAQKGDLVLIQGDFGVVYALVGFAKRIGLVPIYATTERVTVEQKQADGSVLVNKVFKHKRFRKY